MHAAYIMRHYLKDTSWKFTLTSMFLNEDLQQTALDMYLDSAVEICFANGSPRRPT